MLILSQMQYENLVSVRVYLAHNSVRLGVAWWNCGNAFLAKFGNSRHVAPTQALVFRVVSEPYGITPDIALKIQDANDSYWGWTRNVRRKRQEALLAILDEIINSAVVLPPDPTPCRDESATMSYDSLPRALAEV